MNTMDRITIQILHSEVEFNEEAQARAHVAWLESVGDEAREASNLMAKLRDDQAALLRVIKILEERS